jgi:hypothetical protein
MLARGSRTAQGTIKFRQDVVPRIQLPAKRRRVSTAEIKNDASGAFAAAREENRQ